MKCNNCQIDIQYNTNKCPICGNIVEANNLPQLFPKPTTLSNKKINKISINFLALIITLSISFIMLLINIFTFVISPWALISSSILFVSYFIIFFSFNNKHSLAFRNILSFLVLLTFFYFIGYLCGFIKVVTFNILPNIFNLFTMINLLSLLLFDRQKYLLSTFFCSIINFVPLIMFCFNLPIPMIIAIVSTFISIVSIILSLILNRKKLKHIFSSYFHF